MKLLSVMWVVAIAAIFTGLGSGCATGPEISVSSRVLRADHVVYFEQSDRVPKDVMMQANKGATGPMASIMASIPPDVIGKIVEELVGIVPEVTKSYSSERMNNALLNRRMLFIGYGGTNELKQIGEIVDSMGSTIEYLTPQQPAAADSSVFPPK